MSPGCSASSQMVDGKNATRCSYVINIVIIVIINNIPYWLVFSPSPSGVHMLWRRAPAACGSPSSLHTCKRGWAGPLSVLEDRGCRGCLVTGCSLPCSSPSASSAGIPAVLLHPGLCSTSVFPAGWDSFLHSSVLGALYPYATLGLCDGVRLCWCSSRWTRCSRSCQPDSLMVWSTSGQGGEVPLQWKVLWLNLPI